MTYKVAVRISLSVYENHWLEGFSLKRCVGIKRIRSILSKAVSSVLHSKPRGLQVTGLFIVLVTTFYKQSQHQIEATLTYEPWLEDGYTCGQGVIELLLLDVNQGNVLFHLQDTLARKYQSVSSSCHLKKHFHHGCCSL